MIKKPLAGFLDFRLITQLTPGVSSRLPINTYFILPYYQNLPAYG